MVMDIRSLTPNLAKASQGKAEKSKNKSARSVDSSAADSDDSVSLTGHASQISQLIEQMKAAPVLNPDRVSPVKEKVDKGEYQIEYQQVANKMLDFESTYRGY